MKDSIHQMFSQTAQGYASVVLKSVDIRTLDSKTKYILLPVWILTTMWRGKEYTFAINGQNGKITCDLPYDKSIFWKWTVIFTIIFSIIFVAYFIVMLGAVIIE